MNHHTKASTIIPVALILCLIVPVDAYYFQFQYFETDRAVYEVGQTINMVAKLIAEFSDEGWCFVSFGVVTDVGPIFQDGYYIESSLDPQFTTSYYTILPNETYPGLSGTIAHVIFNAEIYDGYSQSITETIEVNITRGHLSVLPLSELELPHGIDSNISLKIASTHNEDVVLQEQVLSYQVNGIDSSYTVEGNESINSQGIATIPLNSSSINPGHYDLTVSTEGTDSFLPLVDTLPIYITPPNSSLLVRSSPDEIHCPDHEGVDIGSVNLLVDHLGEDGERIKNSTISWETVFSQSNFTNHFNGTYSASVQFPVSPGNYTILIIAKNEIYASVNITKTILVTKRTPAITVSFPSGLIAGNETSLQLTLTDSLLESPIPSLEFNVTISLSDQVLYNNATSVNTDGSFKAEFEISSDLWGLADIRVETYENENYTGMILIDTQSVEFVPEVCWVQNTPSNIGQNTSMSVTLLKPDGQSLVGITVSLFDSYAQLIGSTHTDANGTGEFVWTVPSDLPSGSYEYTIVTTEMPSQFALATFLAFQLSHYDLLSVSLQGEDFDCLRGENFTLNFRVDSNWNETQNLLLQLSFSTLITINQTIKSDTVYSIQIPVPADSSLGTHSLTIGTLNNTCVLSGSVLVDINILGRIIVAIESAEAFYAENLSMTLSLMDEFGLSVDEFSITVFLDGRFVDVIHRSNQTIEAIAISNAFSPGIHNLTVTINGTYYKSAEDEAFLTIWMRTSLSLALNRNQFNFSCSQGDEMTSIISSGSIISPPPILFNGTTSTQSPTTRSISRDNCPKLSSGTNNRSTDSEKAFTSLSGNGQTVLSLSDFIDSMDEAVNMTSSTVREVQPYDTIPHSAFSGPLMIVSVRRLRL